MNPPIEPPPGFFDNLPKLPDINPPLTEHEMSLVELAMNGASAIRRLKKSQISNALFHAIPKEQGPMFYVCFECRRTSEIGVGPIEERIDIYERNKNHRNRKETANRNTPPSPDSGANGPKVGVVKQTDGQTRTGSNTVKGRDPKTGSSR